MIKYKCDIPIYFGYLIIIFTDDISPIKDKLELESINYPAFVKGVRDKKGVSEYYMVFKPKYLDHTIIAHEVTHCANWIFFDRKIQPDLLNDEPYAYLVGWITGKVYDLMKRKGLQI